ncbi:MAG: sigma-70 family RNA polymerase sigma factor [Kofleriaceae bacterium]
MNPPDRRATHAAMLRFADGDRSAFREVFDSLWPVLLAVASRALPGRADSEDAAQRAILKVFDRIVDLDRDRDGVAWAITIVGFEILTLRRQSQRRREDDVEVNPHDPREAADDLLIDQELRQAVHHVIARLGERDRGALSELLLGDKPRGEAARKRRFRAVERLRAAWRKAHG